MKNISLHRFYRILKRGKIWRCKRNLRNKNIELIGGGCIQIRESSVKRPNFSIVGGAWRGGITVAMVECFGVAFWLEAKNVLVTVISGMS